MMNKKVNRCKNQKSIKINPILSVRSPGTSTSLKYQIKGYIHNQIKRGIYGIYIRYNFN
jgi:hypothetical protein